MKKKGLLKVVIGGGLVTALVVGLVMGIAGCRPAAPPEEETYTFKYHCPFPPDVYISDVEVAYLDAVAEATGGRVTFDRMFGGILGFIDKQPENLQGGVFDIGQISYVYSPGLYPLGCVSTLPCIEDDPGVWAHATHELMKEEPQVQAEYTALNQKYLFTFALEPMEMMTFEPVQTLEDFEGMRIRAHGGSALAFDKIGWIGVSVPWDELPVVAAEHGVDAGCFPVYITGRDAGLHTIFRYYITPFPIYQFHFAMAINLDTWNDLPADIQQIMLEAADDAVGVGLDLLAARRAEGLQDLADADVITIDWPASEMDRFRELAGEPVWVDWVAEQDAAGRPGEDILSEFQTILAKHR